MLQPADHIICPGGVKVAALVLGTSAFGRVGSNPTWGTILKHTVTSYKVAEKRPWA